MKIIMLGCKIRPYISEVLPTSTTLTLKLMFAIGVPSLRNVTAMAISVMNGDGTVFQNLMH